MAAVSPKNKKPRLQNKYYSSPEWETVFNLASMQTVHPAFAVLQLGPVCNANASASFTDAKCNYRKVGPTGTTSLYMIDFDDVFTKGVDLLLDLRNQSRGLNEEEQRAVDILDTFLKEKENHEQSLSQVLLEFKSGEESDQRTNELTITLAGHLLGRLAPGHSCVLNKRLKVKEEEGKCPCGLDHCDSTPVFESTGIGDKAAWHGFPDIICSSHSVAVVSGKEAHGDDEEEEDSREEKTFCEIKLTRNRGIEDQVIAQTVVFSYIQRKHHPCSQNFLIPNLLISPCHYRILMYDSLNDILICSMKLPIFHDKDRPERLNTASLVFLWMVLHYRIFCVGINVQEILKNGSIKDIKEIQSKFPEQAGEKLHLYEECSKIGISKFPHISEEDLPSFDSFLYGKRLFKSRRLLHALNNKQI